MWNVFLWVILGGLIGWLAYRYVHAGNPGMVGDLVMGVIGALGVNLGLSLLIPGYLNPSFMNVISLGVALIAAAVFVLATHVAVGAVRAARA